MKLKHFKNVYDEIVYKNGESAIISDRLALLAMVREKIGAEKIVLLRNLNENEIAYNRAISDILRTINEIEKEVANVQ